MNSNELQTAIQQAEEIVQEHYAAYMKISGEAKEMQKHGYQAALRRLNKLLAMDEKVIKKD